MNGKYGKCGRTRLFEGMRYGIGAAMAIACRRVREVLVRLTIGDEIWYRYDLSLRKSNFIVLVRHIFVHSLKLEIFFYFVNKFEITETYGSLIYEVINQQFIHFHYWKNWWKLWTIKNIRWNLAISCVSQWCKVAEIIE